MNHIRNHTSRLFAVLMALMFIWVTYLINAVTIANINIKLAIEPRQLSGLWGIFTYAFAHKDLAHLIANSIPFTVLSLFIVYKDGISQLVQVWLVALLGSGAGVWLFGSHGYVIGASGIVFALNGFLLARSYFHPTFANISLAIITFTLYSGTLFQLLQFNEMGISWASHFFGFCTGVSYAFWLSFKTLK